MGKDPRKPITEEEIKAGLMTADRQIQSLEEQRMFIDDKRKRLKTTIDALEHLAQTKAEDVLMPLDNGVFLKVKLSDAGKVMTDIGSGVLKEMNYSETVKGLKKSEDAMGKTEKNIDTQRAQHTLQINTLAQQLMKTRQQGE